MKKIAIISHGLSGGGAERVASLVANNLSDNGYNVLYIAVYSSEKEYKLSDNIKYEYIKTDSKNKYLRLIERSYKIDKLLKSFNPHVAVSFIINETLISNICKRVPIIYTLRNDPYSHIKGFVNVFLCKFLYKRSARVIFQTNGAKKYFSEKIQNKGVIIPNPLSDNLPYWNKDNHNKTIITACRLTAQKNIPMLINAFAQFHNDHTDYELCIYGKGELLSELELLCKSLNIEDCVRFPGYSNNIYKIMSESAIFALTSNFEGLSNSMLEALAIGIPTIVTDCPPGGAAQFVENNVNGFLIPLNDTDMLTKCFCTLAENPDRANSFSDKSIEIRSRLDQNCILEEWRNAIEI